MDVKLRPGESLLQWANKKAARRRLTGSKAQAYAEILVEELCGGASLNYATYCAEGCYVFRAAGIEAASTQKA